MALLFFDSFDHYSDFTQKYDLVATNGGDMTITAVGARNGLCAQTSGSGVKEYFGKNLGVHATYIVGFAFFMPSSITLSTTPTPILSFQEGGSTQLSLLMNQTGNFQFYKGGGTTTAVGSLSSSSLSFNTWHYLEVKVTIDGSAGVAELKVDGSFFLQQSSLNTRVSSNSFATAVIFGQWAPTGSFGNTAGFRFDDVYIIDPTVGSHNTNYLGDLKVFCVFPNGNGTSNPFSQTGASFVANAVMALGQQLIDSNGALQRVTAVTGDAKVGATAPTWTTTLGVTTVSNHATFTLIQKTTLSNFNFVNEPVPDDDNSYVSDSTLNDIERYVYPAIAGSTVAAVAVNARMRKDDGGPRSVRMVTLSSGTTGDNGADIPLSENAYGDYQGILEVDPHTSSPWGVAAVNTAEFGVKITV